MDAAFPKDLKGQKKGPARRAHLYSELKLGDQKVLPKRRLKQANIRVPCSQFINQQQPE